jgi:EAL domain-containing protein (putative c-di-GMP-specific phosphodiesterase class I)
VMRRADIAMYDAKAGGRNRCRRFNAYLDTKRTEDLAVANEMRKLIAQGNFEVEYQPVVSARDRTIVGVEALARWPKSSPRSLGPNQFIPVAEEHGLIDALSSNILRVAFRDMAQWHDLRLAVNISPFQLNNRNLVTEIMEIARVSQFPPSRLEVELTETVMIKNPVRAKEFIQEFRRNGVSVALDDFGTGYASVGYLREFAFDKIKIDRSLTQAVLTSTASQQVVQGTVLIAKGMSTEIVAEGVESDAEAQFMHLAGCQQLQGYYFGRPQSATAIGALLSKENGKAKSAV